MTLRTTLVALAACAAATTAGMLVPAAAQADSAPSYVALGDSYTSGPLILPLSPTAPLDCFQSAANYPHLTAAGLGLPLTDVSCSGADVSDMTGSQHDDQGPQFGALTASTGVVTLGIGGYINWTYNAFCEALLAEGTEKTAFAELSVRQVLDDLLTVEKLAALLESVRAPA